MGRQNKIVCVSINIKMKIVLILGILIWAVLAASENSSYTNRDVQFQLLREAREARKNTKKAGKKSKKTGSRNKKSGGETWKVEKRSPAAKDFSMIDMTPRKNTKKAGKKSKKTGSRNKKSG